MKLKHHIYLCVALVSPVISQELDENLTLEKKALMILPAIEDNEKELADKVLSIISEQATSLGRFEVIDRNLVAEILEEQRLQLSGLVSNDQVVQVGKLAAAEKALILEIVHFGQKGVPKEKEENDDDDDDGTLFTWLVKTVVTETIENARQVDTLKIRLELENNIHTEFKGNVKLVNVASGVSEHSFSLNASFTGGNRDASLSRVLNQLSMQIRMKLKDLYMITSEIIEVDGTHVSIFSGANLGLKKGVLFEISSKDKIKTYKGKTVTLPGKSRGFIRLTDVGSDGSRAKVVRKWRKVKPGHKAYEMKGAPTITDLNFTYSKDRRYEVSGSFWINPFAEFSGSINGYLGSVSDSRNKMNGYLGFGTNLDYTLFSGFGTKGSVSLELPALLARRGDDDGHNVMSFFSDPSLDGNLAIQISQNRDIVLTASYVFTNVHGPWQWQKDTGENDEDGHTITETEPAVWNGFEPVIEPEGLYFSITMRKLRF